VPAPTQPTKYPIIQAFRSKYAELLIRYALAAGTATVWDILVFSALSSYVFTQTIWGLEGSTVSLTISYSTGVVLHFFLARWFVFTKPGVDKPHGQFLKFVLVSVIVFFANLGVLQVLEAIFAGNTMLPFIARGIQRTTAAVLVGLFSFLLNKYYTFR
jgi:putative flippase GtrA